MYWTHAEARAFAKQQCPLAFFAKPTSFPSGPQQVATLIRLTRSLLCCFVSGADDEEDPEKICQEPCERLGYSLQELEKFTRYIKIYVQEQRRIYESILQSLPLVMKWHMHEENSRPTVSTEASTS